MAAPDGFPNTNVFVSDQDIERMKKEAEARDRKKQDKHRRRRRQGRNKKLPVAFTEELAKGLAENDPLCHAFLDYKEAEAQENALRSLLNFVERMQAIVKKKDSS